MSVPRWSVPLGALKVKGEIRKGQAVREGLARRSQATVLGKSQSKKWFFSPCPDRKKQTRILVHLVSVVDICLVETELSQELTRELTGLQKVAV